jgi:hypothetical protein
VKSEGYQIAQTVGPSGPANAAFIVKAVNAYEALVKQVAALRGALAVIHNNTEPDAIRHRDYDDLAASIYKIAKRALDGGFVDDMHAAEVYDDLYPRADVGGLKQP